MVKRLDSKIAIVVGAGSIGADISNGSATAITFSRQGATVVCADKSLEAAKATARQVEECGGTSESFEADVLSADQIKALVDHTIGRYGRIDILHHNVGIEEFGELVEINEASWDRVHAINLRGAMLTNREVMPHMIRQGGGSIINISSLASQRWGQMQYLSYNTSKAALNHMTRVNARQYAPHNVRSNVIVVGMIDSPHAAALFKNEEDARVGRAARHAMCPMGRQGTPWDVANAALFLASDEAAYVTGLEMVVDGGLSL